MSPLVEFKIWKYKLFLVNRNESSLTRIALLTVQLVDHLVLDINRSLSSDHGSHETA